MADIAESQISKGALREIFQDPNTADKRHPFPVFQCLHIKPLTQTQQGTERYRIVLSDINSYCQCMLASQAASVMKDNTLQRGCIVRVRGYQANHVKGKNILIILDLEVLTHLGTSEKLGNPQALQVESTAGPAAPAPAAETAMSGTGFYGNSSHVKNESNTHPGGLPTRAAPADRYGNSVIYPIEALNPYSHKWTIKARVTQKSDIRHWHKASGEGKLFSVNLLDESGEIRATCFNDQVDQFYDLLQEGSVFYISNPCKVSLAKKQFTNLPNDFELTFERDTMVEKAEDTGNVPQVKYNFYNIESLQQVEKDATIDIIGVIKEVGDVSSITSQKTGKPYEKRDLTLVDESSYSIRLTIWGKTANTFEAHPDSIVAFKGVKVSDFGGRSLSLLASGTMAMDPDIPEAHKLRGWYDSQGRTENFNTHSNLASLGAATGRQDSTKCISEIKDENLGMDNPDYFTLKATIMYIKQDTFAYPACISKDCSKKVMDVGDGWRCEKCDITHPNPQYRYIMSVNVNDHTGQLWLNSFDEPGKVIMGMSADELTGIKEEDEARASQIFEAANCKKWNFRCRAKMDTYGDNPRVRYQVMSVAPMDYKTEGHKLADMIKQMGLN